MTAFFIIVSLALNIISLMAIVILFLRQNQLLKVEDNQKKTIREMEELLSSFVLEMKEDNEHFIMRIEEMNKGLNSPLQNNQEQTSPNVMTKKQLAKNTENAEREKNNALSMRMGKTVGRHAVKAYQQQSKQQPEKETFPLPVKNENIKIHDYIEENDLSTRQKQFGSSNQQHQDSVIDQILIMKKKGFSEEEIAKKLNKGKTEIDLLLKFQENQQE
jgi:hypothetical protein